MPVSPLQFIIQQSLDQHSSKCFIDVKSGKVKVATPVAKVHSNVRRASILARKLRGESSESFASTASGVGAGKSRDPSFDVTGGGGAGTISGSAAEKSRRSSLKSNANDGRSLSSDYEYYSASKVPNNREIAMEGGRSASSEYPSSSTATTATTATISGPPATEAYSTPIRRRSTKDFLNKFKDSDSEYDSSTCTSPIHPLSPKSAELVRRASSIAKRKKSIALAKGNADEIKATTKEVKRVTREMRKGGLLPARRASTGVFIGTGTKKYMDAL
jgi:hypothetical protein